MLGNCQLESPFYHAAENRVKMIYTTTQPLKWAMMLWWAVPGGRKRIAISF